MNTLRKLLAVTATVSAISFMAVAGTAAPAFASQTATSDTATSSQRPPPPPPYWSHIKVRTANVRACASTNCRIVRKLHGGAAVHVYYRWNGWSYIGGGRWVASYLIGR
jgi:hypothetical protein